MQIREPSHERSVTEDGALRWRRLAADDLPLLARWLADPIVARWWNHDSTVEGVERDFGASVRGEEPGEDLVVSLDGRPVGLVQRALIHDYPKDLAEFAGLVEVPEGAVELDYLIGEPALRGRGLGPRMIAALVRDTWMSRPATPAILVAVVAVNSASWRALEKAGLRRIAEGPMTPENPADGSLHYVYRAERG
jgi:aminoglycoside 6'-N-acetyltransferase